MIKMYLKLTGDECLTIQDIIKEMFLKISAHILNPTTMIALTTARALNFLFGEVLRALNKYLVLVRERIFKCEITSE